MQANNNVIWSLFQLVNNRTMYTVNYVNTKSKNETRLVPVHRKLNKIIVQWQNKNSTAQNITLYVQ